MIKTPMTISPDDVQFCIETVSGNLVNPTNPDPEAISLHDIAWSLSRIPRFAGHTITGVAYNVAQHSVYVAELLERFVEDPYSIEEFGEQYFHLVEIAVEWKYDKNANLLKGLLHDAHEAYIGDIPSPIKKIPELRPTIKLIESKLDHAILTHFKLSDTTEEDKALIKFCDLIAQAIEGYQFMPSRGRNWVLPKPSLIDIQQFSQPETSINSYKAFIEKFQYLSNQ